MKKKIIGSSSYRFLKNEAAYLENNEVIDHETRLRIVEAYEPREEGMNFIRIILTIGAVLIGLGIISFIASNWQEMGKAFKLIILILGFLGFALSGKILEESYPRTGRSLIYISVMIFGAGIFLIEQMYNISIRFSKSFLLWSLGVLPMAYVLKDKLIFFFANALLLVYGIGNLNYNGIAWGYMALLIAFYVVNRFIFENNSYFMFMENILTAIWIIDVIAEFDGSGLLVACVIFGAGILMKYVLSGYERSLVLQGNLFMGIAGIFLSFKDIWADVDFSYAGEIAIVFGIVLMAYFLMDTQKGHLSSLFFVCILIFRYYVDGFYDFMPKSMFFIIGGLILIAFGYTFERIRKKGGIGHEKRL